MNRKLETVNGGKYVVHAGLQLLCMKKIIISLCLFLLSAATPVTAEYRAYLIGVFDHVSRKSWDTTTGFSPKKYIMTHGGANRLSAMVKASWVCYGDTSGLKRPCPMPKARNPLFKNGESVKIRLEKHITEGWIGIVELSLFREDLKSNVYGVRFGQKRKLYNRYFEFNLEKAKAPTPEKSKKE